MYTIKIYYKNGRISFDEKRYDIKNAAVRRALKRLNHNRAVARIEIWETSKIPSMYL